MKNVKYIVVGCLIAVAAYAAVDLNVSKNTDPRPQQFVAGFYIGPLATTTNKITKSLGNSATVDFTSAKTGLALSSSITVTGAKAGDPCFVGVPTAAAAQQAMFGCYVDATNSVKVWFDADDSYMGTCTLGGQSPSTCTATVGSSSVCTATIVGASAASAAKGVAVGVSSTTLTVTSANGATEDVNFFCKKSVDPASGTYYVRVVSAQ